MLKKKKLEPIVTPIVDVDPLDFLKNPTLGNAIALLFTRMTDSGWSVKIILGKENIFLNDQDFRRFLKHES